MMRRAEAVRFGVAVAAAVAAVAAPARAEAVGAGGVCDAPQVLIVLDRSSSMNDLVAGTTDTKWDVAVTSIDALMTAFPTGVDFGLMIFPDPNECSPGSVFVDVGPGTASAITGELTPPPAAGNWTPLSQSLDAVAAYAPLLDPTRRNYVLLVTDGWQWCSPYDASTRLDAEASATALLGLGIETYAIGFGGSVDPLVLNRIAFQGGTAPAGCDPNGADATAADLCYYQADDSPGLTAALMAIAGSITTEECDGVDNDCNGIVDDLFQACASACGAGIESCEGGFWTGCTAAAPAPSDACNGVDDDCDGAVDEGCACAAGATRACGLDTGACAQGTQTCDAAGLWSPCSGAVSPAPETCNALDDDCNGVPDDAASCPGGQICVGGACVEMKKPDPGVGGDGEPLAADEAYPGGCACKCSVAGPRAPAAGGVALGLGALVALLATLRRSRRRARLTPPRGL